MISKMSKEEAIHRLESIERTIVPKNRITKEFVRNYEALELAIMALKKSEEEMTDPS